MKLVSFGTGTRLYTFPTDTQTSLSDNFNNVVPSTTRLPGLSGGFDDYGDDPAPKEIGNITINFMLVSYDVTAMQAKRDALRKMRTWGRTKLIAQPDDTGMSQRWTWARINNISMPIQEKGHTSIFQPVTIQFQVADPSWYVSDANIPVWGAFTWGGGKKWGGPATTINASGLTTSTTITPVGNDIAKPRISIFCGAGQTAQNPTIQRLYNGVVVDEVSWTGTMIAGDLIVIDATTYKVLMNGADGYTTAFDYLSAEWMRFMPEANSIKITFANIGDAAKVIFTYDEAYS